MKVNKKKSMVLKNKTNYFIPTKDKVQVRFSSPYSYQNRQNKIEAIETRLYYQFKYCEENNGQTFFYTLTYNDKALPHYHKMNCFDYEDLRDLLTGGFRKQLLRKYGTVFKYFVGAELGDGKGTRGMHNNPHYHILFFLESAKNEKYPYTPILPEDFRHLVRLYWQGFDEATDGYKDYNLAKYGIAKEGENCGKVTDFRACCYVAKYVCKDVKLVQYEEDVKNYLRFKALRSYKSSEQSYKDYYYSRIYELFNIPKDSKSTEWVYNDAQLLYNYVPELMNNVSLFFEIDSFKHYVVPFISKFNLYEDYCQFVNQHIEVDVKKGLNEYRNRYCNKCRISQGLGESALPLIDKLSPTIQVPSKDGFKNRPIGLYYYRKLFTDVVKDKRTGQNIYVLNEDGIRYKVNSLSKRLVKCSSDAKNNLSIVLNNKDLFEKMKESDVNTGVFMSHSDLLRDYNKLNDLDKKEIYIRYAEYKLVYEDRFFQLVPTGDRSLVTPPDISVVADYKRFLEPSYFHCNRNDLMLDMFLENTPEDYLPYYAHPYFLRYISLFRVLDLCSDYWFVQTDNKKQSEAERIAGIRRFHNQRALQQFYSNFR